MASQYEQCPICKTKYKYGIYDNIWGVDSEWWTIDGFYPFLDSWTCYKKARKIIDDIEEDLKK